MLNRLIDSQKRFLIFNSIIKLQFHKCPLIWMFCFGTSSNMISKIHKWALRLILNDHTGDFVSLLQSNNDTCNHHRNIQTLMVETYKIKNNLNPLIRDFMFERRNDMYNLRNFQESATKEKEWVYKTGSWNFKVQISVIMINFAWNLKTNLLARLIQRKR